MIRRLFTLASAMSLLVCITAAAMWVRSYVRSEMLLIAWVPQYAPGGHDANGVGWAGVTIHPSLGMESNRGLYRMGTGLGDWMDHRRKIELLFKPFEADANDSSPRFEFATYPRLRRFPHVPQFSLTVPDAILVAAFAVLPVIWVLRLRRTRRVASRGAPQGCRRCGYDLRASKDRCPECRTPSESTPTLDGTTQPADDV